MNLLDTLPLEGTLDIWKVYTNTKDRHAVLVYSGKNLITLATKQFILSGIYLPAITSDPVNSLHVGTGGTVDPEGLFPKQEDQTWTNLNTPLLTVSTSYVLNNTVPSVTFLADVDQSSANGSLISEAALFRTGGTMFNIKCFPGIPKTSEFSLHFEWTIKAA